MHNSDTILLTTDELAKRIKYDSRYIREILKDSVFIEGVHYIRPFGRSKILFVWKVIEAELMESMGKVNQGIPMSAGGYFNG